MEANLKWVLITAIAPVAWGTTYFVTRHFLPVDYPLYGAVIRALPAGLFLLAITRKRPHGSWWWKSLVLGTLNVGTFFILVYLAAQLLPSSIASTLMASSAAVMMLLAWPILSERPGIFSIIGAATGFSGVCIMLLTGTESVNLFGVLASLAAMALSSIGYILTKKWGPDVSILALTSWQLIAGALVVAPIAVMTEGAFPYLDAQALLGFSYVTFLATALAFAAWFAGLRHLRAGTVGIIGLLNPVTGVLLGVFIASEPFGPRQIIGTILVLLGVLIGQQKNGSFDRLRPKKLPLIDRTKSQP